MLKFSELGFNKKNGNLWILEGSSNHIITEKLNGEIIEKIGDQTNKYNNYELFKIAFIKKSRKKFISEIRLSK